MSLYNNIEDIMYELLFIANIAHITTLTNRQKALKIDNIMI